MEEGMPKNELQKRKKQVIAILICMLYFISAFFFIPEWIRAESVTSASCVYGGSTESIGKAGCLACGGTGKDWEIGHGENSMQLGSYFGLNVRQETDRNGTVWKVYYRCYNCGDTGYNCEKYSEMVYKEQVGNPGKTEYGGASRGQGYVPIRWCTHCGPSLKTKGDAYYTVASWAQYHLPIEPTKIPLYKLTVTAETGGRVQGDSGVYEEGASIFVQAEAEEGYEFVGWTGTWSSTDTGLSFSMPARNVVLTAQFQKEAVPTGKPDIMPTVSPTPKPTKLPLPTVSPTPLPTPIPRPFEIAGPIEVSPAAPIPTPHPSVNENIHDDRCYTGELHICDNNCYTPIYHTHMPDCYQLSVVGEMPCPVCRETGKIPCQDSWTLVETWDVSFSCAARSCKNCGVVSATAGGCTYCGADDWSEKCGYSWIGQQGNAVCNSCGKTSAWSNRGDCAQCGAGGLTNYFFQQHGEMLCTNCKGYGKIAEEELFLVCGKTENYIEEYKPGCGKGNGFYYDADGTVCMPVCDEVVISLIPHYAKQILQIGEEPNIKAYASFYLETHGICPVQTVECKISGFDRQAYNTWQTVTLSYGKYDYSAKNPYPAKTTIQVYISGDFPITFDANGGSCEIKEKTVTYGKPYGTLPVPVRSQYAFYGWIYKNRQITAESMVAEPTAHTLTAAWIPLAQVVSFDANGGECDVKEKNVTYGKPYGILPVPVRTGYQFTGWWYGDNVITEISIVTAYQNHTLVAGWVPCNYTVSLDANGGECGIKQVTVQMGASYNQNISEAVAVRTGHTFVGWQTENGEMVYDKTGKWCEGNYWNYGKWKYPENITLYAGWEINTYQIWLDGQGAEEHPQNSVLVVYGQKPPAVTIPSRRGYLFAGYFSETEGRGECYFNAKGRSQRAWTKAEDGVLYAKWEPIKYTVQIAKDEIRTEPVEIQEEYTLFYGEEITMPPQPADKSCQITYDLNRGIKSTNPQFVTSLSEVNTMVRLKFAGWRLYQNNKDGYMDLMKWYEAGQVVKNMTIVHGDILTLFPFWGGADAFVVLPEAVCEGYTFHGWGYAEYEKDMTKILPVKQGEITKYQPKKKKESLYAFWTPNHYTVELDGQGANVQLQTATVMVFDESVPVVEVPKKSGYIFEGYYTEPAGNGVPVYDKQGMGLVSWNVDFISIQTLYAYWKPAVYTVTFDWNFNWNATGYQTETNWTGDTKQVIYDKNYGTLPLPERFGYTFAGWYLQETEENVDVQKKITEESIVKTAENHVLYAKWNVNTYTVLLDQRGALIPGQTSFEIVFDTPLSDLTGKMPQKKGYTFHGYYSGKGGSGVKYFDETGQAALYAPQENPSDLFNGENFVHILYAYWTQDAVILPEPGEKEEPDEEDWETKEEGSIKEEVMRIPAEIAIYAEDYCEETGAANDLQPYIAKEAIPGTEEVAVRAKMDAWLLSYQLQRHAGVIYVPYTVTVSYRTQYETAEEELVVSETQTYQNTYLIPKTWSYYALETFGLYEPKEVLIKNEALLGKEIKIMLQKDAQTPYPNLEQTVYGTWENHVRWQGRYLTEPGAAAMELQLSDVYLISDKLYIPPDAEKILNIICENAAWEDRTQFQVHSDRLVWDGELVLDDTPEEINGKEYISGILPTGKDKAPATWYRQAYRPHILLDVQKENAEYETYAEIRYIGDKNNVGVEPEIRMGSSDDRNGAEIQTNPVSIHTPVVCDGKIKIGQGTLDEGVLTLNHSLNFFKISISNYGTHRLQTGYGEKEFRYALRGSTHLYALDGFVCNQVRFPFDVFLDIDNNTKTEQGTDTEGDLFIRAGSWITTGFDELTFYVPFTQKEGEYEVEFRTLAANVPQEFLFDGVVNETVPLQYHANTDPVYYGAYDVAAFKIQSAILDFEITKTNDMAAELARLSGKHPLTLKKGYWFNFRITTQGSFSGKNAQINITPQYVWLSESGRVRDEAVLYYHEVIDGKLSYYVRAGSEKDAGNRHLLANTDRTLGIEKELLLRTKYLLKESDFLGKKAAPFTFQQIVLDTAVRVFPKTDLSKLPLRYCPFCQTVYRDGEKAKCLHELESTGINERADRAVQQWYGQFYIPDAAYLVKEENALEFETYAGVQSLSGKEPFFEKDGFLRLAFFIKGYSDTGQELLFENWDKTNLVKQWKMEESSYQTGDILQYYVGKKAGDDYTTGGVE